MNDIFKEFDIECINAKHLISSGQCVEVNNCLDIHLLKPLYNLVEKINEVTDTDIINHAIDALCNVSRYRFNYHENRGADMFYTSYMDLMSDHEKSELHRLKLLLPSSGQLVAEAKERIRARLLARKNTKSAAQGIT